MKAASAEIAEQIGTKIGLKSDHDSQNLNNIRSWSWIIWYISDKVTFRFYSTIDIFLLKTKTLIWSEQETASFNSKSYYGANCILFFSTSLSFVNMVSSNSNSSGQHLGWAKLTLFIHTALHKKCEQVASGRNVLKWKNSNEKSTMTHSN